MELCLRGACATQKPRDEFTLTVTRMSWRKKKKTRRVEGNQPIRTDLWSFLIQMFLLVSFNYSTLDCINSETRAFSLQVESQSSWKPVSNNVGKKSISFRRWTKYLTLKYRFASIWAHFKLIKAIFLCNWDGRFETHGSSRKSGVLWPWNTLRFISWSLQQRSTRNRSTTRTSEHTTWLTMFCTVIWLHTVHKSTTKCKLICIFWYYDREGKTKWSSRVESL